MGCFFAPHRLYTAPCGIRNEWPSGRRNPLYNFCIYFYMAIIWTMVDHIWTILIWSIFWVPRFRQTLFLRSVSPAIEWKNVRIAEMVSKVIFGLFCYTASHYPNWDRYHCKFTTSFLIMDPVAWRYLSPNGAMLSLLIGIRGAVLSSTLYSFKTSPINDRKNISVFAFRIWILW